MHQPSPLLLQSCEWYTQSWSKGDQTDWWAPTDLRHFNWSLGQQGGQSYLTLMYHFSWASDCLCALSMCSTSLVCGGGVTLTGWWQLNCNYLREGGCGFNTSWGIPCNACLTCVHCLLLCLLLCCVCSVCVVLYCTCPCVHCRQTFPCVHETLYCSCVCLRTPHHV